MKDVRKVIEKIALIIRKQTLIVILFCLAVIISIIQPRFLLPQNLINVLIQIAINALIATGMTFVIISGGIDLSVGSITALCGIVATAIIVKMPEIIIFQSFLLSLTISVIVGFITGGFSGFVISKLNVPPFMATLAMMSIARGFAFVYTQGRPIYGLPESFSWIGQDYIGFIPVVVIIMAIVLLSAHIILARTVFGRRVYAIGSNEEVAKLCGINVSKIKFIVYVISGILSAFAGVCLASRLITGQPNAAVGYELNAIAAVVMGGNSLSGGKGGIGKTIVGLLAIGIINNGLNLMRVSSYWQSITMGAIILTAIIIDQYRKKTD